MIVTASCSAAAAAAVNNVTSGTLQFQINNLVTFRHFPCFQLLSVEKLKNNVLLESYAIRNRHCMILP